LAVNSVEYCRFIKDHFHIKAGQRGDNALNKASLACDLYEREPNPIFIHVYRKPITPKIA